MPTTLFTYTRLYAIGVLPTVTAGSRIVDFQVVCYQLCLGFSLRLIPATLTDNFLPSKRAQLNGQAVWATNPLGTLFGLPSVLIYVFTDGSKSPREHKGYPIRIVEQYTRVELVTKPWQGFVLPLN